MDISCISKKKKTKNETSIKTENYKFSGHSWISKNFEKPENHQKTQIYKLGRLDFKKHRENHQNRIKQHKKKQN